MTSLNYVTITESWADGGDDTLSGYVTFTPSQSVYANGVPLVTVDSPLTVQIENGVLGTCKLLATDNELEFLTLTGFLIWSVQVVIAGGTQQQWSFFLPSSPASRDLYSLANSTSPTGVTSVNTQTGVVTLTASSVGAIATSALGAANGAASLNSSGQVPAGQLGLAVLASEVGAANGVPSLNSSGQVPAAQLGLAVLASEVGAANGVPSLNSSSQIPTGQIPTLPYVPTSQVGAASGVAGLDANTRLAPANRDNVSASTYTPGSLPSSLTSGTVYRYSCSAGNITQTLPTAPATGTAIGFARTDTGTTYTLTISPGGSDTIPTPNPTVVGPAQIIVYVYTAGSPGQWNAISSVLPLANLLTTSVANTLYASIGLPVYQGNAAYVAGQLVVYSNALYYALNAIASSPVTFNPAQWQAVGALVPSGGYLCAPSQYAPTGASPTALTASTTSWTAFSSCSTNSFTAPASGEVMVTASFVANSSATTNLPAVALALHGTTTIQGYASQIQFSSAGAAQVQTVKFLVSGLTPGTSYQFDLMGACGSTSATGGSWSISAWGNTAAPTLSDTNKWGGPVVMEVQQV